MKKGSPKIRSLDRGPIRVRMSAKTAFDLGSFKKGVRNLLEELGCRACFSGFSCQFEMVRDYVINEKLDVVSAVSPTDIVGAVSPTNRFAYAGSGSSNLSLNVSETVAGNIEEVDVFIDRVAGLVGCPACHSGFDILFRNEIQTLGNASLR